MYSTEISVGKEISKYLRSSGIRHMAILRLFKQCCICFFWECSWMMSACLSDKQPFCRALLTTRVWSSSSAPLGSAVPCCSQWWALLAVISSLFPLPINAAPLSQEKYNIHRKGGRRQGAMPLFLNDASMQSGMETPGFWSPLSFSCVLHMTQHLTEKRKSLFWYQILYLEISIKSCFCARQLLASWRSYLTTPTCGSSVMKLGTDLFNGLFKWKKQFSGSPRETLTAQMSFSV